MSDEILVAEAVAGAVPGSLPAARQELSILAGQLGGPVVEVPIDALRPADSPRLDGLDPQHATALAEVGSELPPILAHRATMRVIDGTHRVYAARLAGRQKIGVRFFDGGGDDAFLLAVAANVAHGLPLTLAERKAAADRIIRSRPEMSDRLIAGVVGLAAKTVAAIRVQTTDLSAQMSVRIGRDGRAHPLNAAVGRRIAADVVRARPEASLRTIAREAGISVGTARDVRERIRRGQDPTLGDRSSERDGAPQAAALRARSAPARDTTANVDQRLLLARLRRDPTLRYNESGRLLLRWLGTRVFVNEDWQQMLGGIPPHTTFVLAKIARACAAAWSDFAAELDQKADARA
jgi:hypothetical protein